MFYRGDNFSEVHVHRPIFSSEFRIVERCLVITFIYYYLSLFNIIHSITIIIWLSVPSSYGRHFFNCLNLAILIIINFQESYGASWSNTSLLSLPWSQYTPLFSCRLRGDNHYIWTLIVLQDQTHWLFIVVHFCPIYFLWYSLIKRCSF